MPARKNTTHLEIVRARIRSSQIVNRFIAYFRGDLDPRSGQPVVLTAGQIRVGAILLAKTVPDLLAVHHSGTLDTTRVEELTNAQLADIARAGSDGVIEAPPRLPEPGQVH